MQTNWLLSPISAAAINPNVLADTVAHWASSPEGFIFWAMVGQSSVSRHDMMGCSRV
jgi:hypothetical protein